MSLSDDEAKERLRRFMEAQAALYERMSPEDREQWLKDKFGEMRARGAPIRAAKPYLVGEHRAELFRPTTGGFIDPLSPPEGEEP